MSNAVKRNQHECRTKLFNNRTVGLDDLPRDIAGRRAIIANTYRQAKPSLITKPGRRYGCTWMDKFIQMRQGVNLCDVCARIYGPALTSPKYQYRVDKYGLKLGDCDGCGGTGQPETLYPYYPSNKFEALRLKPNPNFIVKGVT